MRYTRITMSPQPFYTVPSNSYLFGKSSERPEEIVRQWALFELMTTYGYSIDNIRVEYPAQVGSKKFPADIVILRDERPYIVIECKRQEIKYSGAWSQVISYADNLSAPFAIWTNGRKWMVKRKVKGNWCPVEDIPYRQFICEKNLSNHLEDISFLAESLYWHNCSIPSEYVPDFLLSLSFPLTKIESRKLSKAPISLQRSFHHLCYLAIETPNVTSDPFAQSELVRRLLLVLENLERFFRYLDYDGEVGGTSNNYKIDRSRSYLSSYVQSFEQTGKVLKGERSAKEIVIWEMMLLLPSIRYLTQVHADLNDHTFTYLAAFEAVGRYIESFRTSSSGILSEGQVDQIHRIFQETFFSPLGMLLPSKLDPEGTEDLHKFCEHYWENVIRRKKESAKMKRPRIKIVKPGDPKYQEMDKVIKELEQAWDEEELMASPQEDEMGNNELE
jgi:Type I restriction enzyme R protein N terminus (HSDR_N)